MKATTQNQDDWFDSPSKEVAFGGVVLKSTIYTTIAQVLKLVIQIGSIALLARLLSPEDFGIVAMVSIFTGLALQFTENGLCMGIVQDNRLRHRQASNIYWVSILAGGAIWLVICLFSSSIASLYNTPELAIVVVIYSAVFLVSAMCAPYISILRRRMNYLLISMIDVVSMLLGFISAVVCAVEGMGYWSLVVNVIVIAFVKLVICWFFVPWKPSRFSYDELTRSNLKYGIDLSFANIVGYGTTNSVPFVLGILGGANLLGNFNRSFNIASIPSKQLLPPIINVMQSALSRLSDDVDRFKRAGIELMSQVALLTVLISCSIYQGAELIVSILLGDGWDEAIPMLKILSITTLATPITSLTTVMLIARGEAAALLRWRLCTLLMLMAAIGIGSYWGGWGVMYAYAASTILIRTPLFFCYASKYQPVRAAEFLKVLMAPLVFGLFSVVLVQSLQMHNGGIFQSSMGVILVVILYCVACLTYKGTRVRIFELFNRFRKLARR